MTPATSNCLSSYAPLCNGRIVSPVEFLGVYHGWTTGMVTHVDRAGDFTKIRRATGHDTVPAPGAGLGNWHRELQLVSPWSASVRPLGPFGLPVPEMDHGGIAVFNVKVTSAAVDWDMSDSDLVFDYFDNCLAPENGPNDPSDQTDPDLDGYGDVCDTDYNNDGFTIFVAAFVGAAPNLETNHNHDAATTILDFPAFFEDVQSIGQAPGPSALSCAGTVPCRNRFRWRILPFGVTHSSRIHQPLVSDVRAGRGRPFASRSARPRQR